MTHIKIKKCVEYNINIGFSAKFPLCSIFFLLGVLAVMMFQILTIANLILLHCVCVCVFFFHFEKIFWFKSKPFIRGNLRRCILWNVVKLGVAPQPAVIWSEHLTGGCEHLDWWPPKRVVRFLRNQVSWGFILYSWRHLL